MSEEQKEPQGPRRLDLSVAASDLPDDLAYLVKFAAAHGRSVILYPDGEDAEKVNVATLDDDEILW